MIGYLISASVNPYVDNMKGYVDGYVLPIPKKHLKEYKQIAKMASTVWMKHGALAYFECIGDDLESKWGIPFPKAIKTKPSETVIFSFVIFKSKAHRKSVNGKVFKDPLMNDPKVMKAMEYFDMKRMIYGGFLPLVMMQK